MNFRGHPCAYCVDGISTRSGDHVLARAFVLEAYRANLPKVPACERCNNAKSRLEHVLASILPFGGRHAQAGETLMMVEPRLEKNQRLASELRVGLEPVVESMTDGSFALTTSIPIDGEKLEELAKFMGRGLLFHHGGVRLTDDQSALAFHLDSHAESSFESILNMAGDRVEGDLGGGTLKYTGIRSKTEPHVSVWRLEFYDGIRTQSDDGSYSRGVIVLTGSNAFLCRMKNHLKL